MNYHMNSFVFDSEGNVVLDESTGNPLQVTSGDLINSLLVFHLLTDPGEYKLDRSVGFGLRGWMGRLQSTKNLLLLQRELNTYFSVNSHFHPFRVHCRVSASGDSKADLTLFVSGEGAVSQKTLILNISDGRITEKMNLSGGTEEDSIIYSTEPGVEVNPFLSRLGTR